MNILLIDNNKLPIELRLVEKIVTDECAITPCQLEYTSAHEVNFDEYISQKLSEHLSQTNFDVICLPFSVSENYTEYTGLRVAAHIRLSHDWNHAGTPIVFLGIDNISNVLHFSNLGTMLLTKNVFVRKSQNVKELALACKDIFSKDIAYTYVDEKYFIDTIRIEAPSNYGSHHSIANLWAIIRWCNMFTDVDAKGMLPQTEVQSMLYFKYLLEHIRVRNGERQEFSRKDHRNNKYPMVMAPYIQKENKKLLYIDDEYKKWELLLSTICEKHNIQLEAYKDFPKGIKKHELINRIKKFIQEKYDSHQEYDCYLVDLRLHDDDFASDLNIENISGHDIITYIMSKEINCASQVVAFTASNKIWNQNIAAETGARGYVIKESPEQNLSKEDSYRLYINFIESISNACRESYITKYARFLKDKRISKTNLNAILDLLILENGNLKKDKILKSLIILLNVYIEDKITNDFEFVFDNMTHKPTQTEYNLHNKVAIKYNKNNEWEDFKCTKDDILSPQLDWNMSINYQTAKPQILAALFFHYGINKTVCDRVILKLIPARNSIGHEDFAHVSLCIEDVMAIIEDVVKKII